MLATMISMSTWQWWEDRCPYLLMKSKGDGVGASANMAQDITSGTVMSRGSDIGLYPRFPSWIEAPFPPILRALPTIFDRIYYEPPILVIRPSLVPITVRASVNRHLSLFFRKVNSQPALMRAFTILALSPFLAKPVVRKVINGERTHGSRLIANTFEISGNELEVAGVCNLSKMIVGLFCPWSAMDRVSYIKYWEKSRMEGWRSGYSMRCQVTIRENYCVSLLTSTISRNALSTRSDHR